MKIRRGDVKFLDTPSSYFHSGESLLSMKKQSFDAFYCLFVCLFAALFVALLFGIYEKIVYLCL